MKFSIAASRAGVPSVLARPRLPTIPMPPVPAPPRLPGLARRGLHRWRELAVGVGLALAATLATAATPAAREIEQQYRSGATTLALQRLDRALAERPGDADLRFLKAVLLAESGQVDEAAVWYERMTQDFPELPEPHNNLAVLRAGAGQLDAARALLEAALRLAPDYRTARENLGDVYVRLAARAYAAAAQGTTAEPLLLRKLTLARELGALR